LADLEHLNSSKQSAAKKLTMVMDAKCAQLLKSNLFMPNPCVTVEYS